MTVKKALIFAAGFGKRLAPITDNLPKPLVRVAGKPLIQYHIEKLVQLGITDIVINTHWLHEQLLQYLGDGSSFGAKIQWSYEPKILNTGGGMQNALRLLGDAPFILVSADVWTDYSFEPLMRLGLLEQNQHALAHLVMVKNPKHNPTGDFSLDLNDSDFSKIQLLINEKASQNNSYTYSGIGLFRSEFILQYIKSKQDESELMEKTMSGNINIEPYPLIDPLNAAISSQAISAEVYTGLWHDIGTIERLKALEKELI